MCALLLCRIFILLNIHLCGLYIYVTATEYSNYSLESFTLLIIHTIPFVFAAVVLLIIQTIAVADYYVIHTFIVASVCIFLTAIEANFVYVYDNSQNETHIGMRIYIVDVSVTF